METKEIVLIHGVRGEEFISFLKELFKKGDVKDKYISCLLSQRSLRIFNQVFTHESYDKENNYEFLESLGDSTFGKVLLWWFSRKYPKINRPEHSEIMGRIKIMYAARKTLHVIGETMGIWKFISMEKSEETKRKKITEDVVEALIAAIEGILDREYILGVGYHIIYNILSFYLDKLNIEISYSALVDDITKLDYLRKQWNKNHKEEGKRICIGFDKEMIEADKFKVSYWIRLGGYGDGCFMGNNVPLSYSIGYTEQEAKHRAAKSSLETLQKMGYESDIPEVYKNIHLYIK